MIIRKNEFENRHTTKNIGHLADSANLKMITINKMYLGLITYFWSTDEFDSDMAAGRALYSAKAEFSRYGLKKKGGFSVRCIRD